MSRVLTHLLRLKGCCLDMLQPRFGLCCENGKDAVNSTVFRELRGTDFMHTSTAFKWRHFQAEIILLCVRWYLRYPLSCRDQEEMMLERGLHVDHTTIYPLRTSTGETLPTSSQNHERLMARRRDVHQSEKGLVVSLSRRGFPGKHSGIFAQPYKKCSIGQTLLLKSACCAPFQHTSRHHGC